VDISEADATRDSDPKTIPPTVAPARRLSVVRKTNAAKPSLGISAKMIAATVVQTANVTTQDPTTLARSACPHEGHPKEFFKFHQWSAVPQ